MTNIFILIFYKLLNSIFLSDQQFFRYITCFTSTAKKTASEILERAKFESKLIADEAAKEIEREIEQKMKLADEKIERAQNAAVENIRTKAIEDAIEVAKEILAKELQSSQTSEKSVEKSLRLIASNIS